MRFRGSLPGAVKGLKGLGCRGYRARGYIGIYGIYIYRRFIGTPKKVPTTLGNPHVGLRGFRPMLQTLPDPRYPIVWEVWSLSVEGFRV